MCDFIRRINNKNIVKSYPLDGSKQEKLNSDLIQDLGEIISLFKITNDAVIPYVLAAQAYGKNDAHNIRYVKISHNLIIVDRLEQTDDNIPWKDAASMHYNYAFVNDDDKILIADAICSNQNVISIDPSIIKTCAQKLIDNGSVSKDSLKYMK